MATLFTKAVGIGFIILSVLRLTPIINATGKWLLYFSISAFLLILSDLLEFVIEGIIVEKGVKGNRIRELIRSIFIGGAVLVMIVLPYLKINIPVKTVNALSDTITLVSLGIAITLIGFKTERVQASTSNMTKNQVKEFISSTEGRDIIVKEINQLLSEDQRINKNKVSN